MQKDVIKRGYPACGKRCGACNGFNHFKGACGEKEITEVLSQLIRLK